MAHLQLLGRHTVASGRINIFHTYRIQAQMSCIGARNSTFATDRENANILEKYGSYSNYLIQKEIEKREEKTLKETMANHLKKLKVRESNLARPPLIYEGPVYFNYWVRKRRSGARK